MRRTFAEHHTYSEIGGSTVVDKTEGQPPYCHRHLSTLDRGLSEALPRYDEYGQVIPALVDRVLSSLAELGIQHKKTQPAGYNCDVYELDTCDLWVTYQHAWLVNRSPDITFVLPK